MARTPVDLFAFGSRTKGPRLPRLGIDVFPDEQGRIGPEIPMAANGASTFGDVTKSLMTGHYFMLPADTELPAGLGVVADGQDVRPDSVYQPTHHTIFPSDSMTGEQFIEMFRKLPWRYAGKKT